MSEPWKFLRWMWDCACEAWAAARDAVARFARDEWECEDGPERVKCTRCEWSGLVTECFGAVFCDCPKCLEPVKSEDGKEWATHK